MHTPTIAAIVAARPTIPTYNVDAMGVERAEHAVDVAAHIAAHLAANGWESAAGTVSVEDDGHRGAITVYTSADATVHVTLGQNEATVRVEDDNDPEGASVLPTTTAYGTPLTLAEYVTRQVEAAIVARVKTGSHVLVTSDWYEGAKPFMDACGSY